jgi:cobalt-zinc-cadmium efflux system membrane fusion protein
VGSIWFEEDPAVIQAESTLVAAAATYQLTSKELARAKELYGANGGLAQRELEQATSDAQTAAAALKAAREAVGALGESDAEIDEMIAAGKIHSETAAHGPSRWLLANVSESDSPLINPGQPVEVRALAYPDRVFHGKVSKVYSTVDPNTHRVSVRCEIQDPVSGLRPGMLASFVIQVQPPVESTAAPVNGVVREGDGSMTVWITADRRHFAQRTVETGLREDGQVQILKGLKPGELVVTDGAIFLDNMLQAPPGD